MTLNEKEIYLLLCGWKISSNKLIGSDIHSYQPPWHTKDYVNNCYTWYLLSSAYDIQMTNQENK